MVSGAVSVRLPEEVLAELEKLATEQGRKVSDVVRDLIISGLKSGGKPTSDEHNELVIEYLQGFGAVLMALMHESAGARYFAEIATSYATDMESLLRERKVMDPETKAALMEQFECAALKVAQETWEKVLGVDQEHNRMQGKHEL